MMDLMNIGDQIIRVILQALGYGFLAGFAFFLLPWGVQKALKIFIK